jgi:hypothetical protein
VSDEQEVRREGQSSVKVGQNAKGERTFEVKVYRPPADPEKGSSFEELADMLADAQKAIDGAQRVSY